MERLTEWHGGIWGLSVKAVENGYDRYSVYSKLAAYEDICPTPGQPLEIDKIYLKKCEIYLKKCEEVNRLKKQLESELESE